MPRPPQPALLASLPGRLDREPAEELVLVGVTDRAPAVAVVVTVPLGQGDLLDAVHDAVRQVRRDAAEQVAVIVYADRTELGTPAATAAATACSLVEEAGMRVLDAIRVTDRRWWSYNCTKPCCPPEGSPVPSPLTTGATPR